MRKRSIMTLSALLMIAGIVALAVVARGGVADWRTASRAPVGLAPDPVETPEAVVQVYAARGPLARLFRGSQLGRREAGGRARIHGL
jgi:hypothetical protein